MARVSRLANPDFAKAVGEAYAAGASRPEMSEMFGAHVDTITDWVRDPRVQAHASRYAQERANRISRKLDAEFERRLENVDDEDTYSLEILLKWRKEFARPFDFGDGGSGGAQQSETVNEVLDNLEENPDMALAFQEMLAKRGAKE